MPRIQCGGGGARGGGAMGDVCFVLIGLEAGLVAGLWSREGPVWAKAGLLSDHASFSLTGWSAEDSRL